MTVEQAANTARNFEKRGTYAAQASNPRLARGPQAGLLLTRSGLPLALALPLPLPLALPLVLHRPINYGEAVQLLHAKSGKFLKL